MTGNAEVQASASQKDIQRSHSFETCASLDSTMIQCNTAHASLNRFMEAEDNVLPDPEGELLQGW